MYVYRGVKKNMVFTEDLQFMKTALVGVELHLGKLEGGTKSSSTKARADLLSIKKLTDKMRKDVTAFLKTLPAPVKAVKAVKPAAEEEPEPAEVPEPVEPKKLKKPRTKKV